jgi:alpha-L-arabinofuranosidase
MRTDSLMKLGLLLVFVFPGLGYARAAAAPPPGEIVATVDTTTVSQPVSKYEYGMFNEHIGTLIYRSLWSEMLDDRKFYSTISSTDLNPEGQGSPFRNMQLRKWRPVGPGEVVVMDKDKPFVGDQSPRIELDAFTPHGIKQSSLVLVKGKKYTGRIYLCGTPGSKIKASLIWGEGANGRQNISFSIRSDAYKKFPPGFISQVAATEGALEITGTGRGNFHIGTASLMPADNLFKEDEKNESRWIGNTPICKSWLRSRAE